MPTPADPKAAWLVDAFAAEAAETKTGPRYTLDASRLLDVALRLDAEGFVLSSLTGLDTGDALHVVAHFAAGPHDVIAIHVPVVYDGDVPTLTGVWPAADWQERETAEMFGVRFVGHPDLRRLFLTDEFEGHPLRKSYGLEEAS